MATAEHTIPGRITATQAAAPTREGTTEIARRMQRLVAVFRLIVALSLLVVGIADTEPPLLAVRFPSLFASAALGYALFAATALAVQWQPQASSERSVLMQLAADIVAVTVLTYAGGGIASGIGGLLVVLVGAASLSLGGRLALLAAALCALAVLGEQALAFAQGLSPTSAFIPAGVLGAIIFVIAAAASPLERRLQESEALARQRGIDLANLAQLNDYVIQHLRESIVVVDADDRVRLINQSAADLLGIPARDTGMPLRQLSGELNRTLRNWRRGDAGPDSTLGFPSSEGTTRINTYFAPLEQRSDGPVLMFLEDASLLAEKVRQTKLVALGRLSASIAHEIRNPIGALSHAGQLLQESPAIGQQERRLLDIINTNSRRVSEIVENVLQLSRRDSTRPEMIAVGQWVRDFCSEFVATVEVPQDRIRLSQPPEEVEVRMDPSHLRQVCWNLLENAIKFSAGADVDMSYGRLSGTRRPFLEVADRGPGISPEMRDRLFEPFATGHPGGTGLGLFISRELCECNRASLVHEARPGGGSIFRVVFADPQRWETAS